MSHESVTGWQRCDPSTLYGVKQSPYHWFRTLKAALEALGYKQLDSGKGVDDSTPIQTSPAWNSAASSSSASSSVRSKRCCCCCLSLLLLKPKTVFQWLPGQRQNRCVRSCRFVSGRFIVFVGNENHTSNSVLSLLLLFFLHELCGGAGCSSAPPFSGLSCFSRRRLVVVVLPVETTRL